MCEHYFVTPDYKYGRERNRKEYLELHNKPDINIKGVESSICRVDIDIVRHNMCVGFYSSDNKNLLFAGGLGQNYINETYNSDEEYWLGLPTLFWIICSDNKEMYQILFKNFRGNLDDKKGGYLPSKMVHDISVGNWDALERDYEKFISVYESFLDPFKCKEIYKELFKAFLSKDTQQISSSLMGLEHPKIRKLRAKHITEEQYISIFTTALAKLAWMHGMEVEVNSPYVPKELLPFEPLEEYTIPYRFLRDYYRPLEYTWRYDPVHPELQDWANDPENPDRGKKKGLLGRWFG